jgi:hypothetical protein
MRLSRRWWQNAGFVFGSTSFLGFWISALFAALSAMGPLMSEATFLRTAAALFLVGPAILAVVVATLIERLGAPEPPPAPAQARRERIRTIAAFAFPFVAGPLTLAASIVVTRVHAQSWEAGLKAKLNPPIVDNGRPGFCAPPRFLVVSGKPVVDLTVRLPKADRYTWSVMAYDRERETWSGEVEGLFPRGVQLMRIPLEPLVWPPLGDSAAVARPIAWPITVGQVLVRSRTVPWHDGRSDMTNGLGTIAGPPSP